MKNDLGFTFDSNLQTDYKIIYILTTFFKTGTILPVKTSDVLV